MRTRVPPTDGGRRVVFGPILFVFLLFAVFRPCGRYGGRRLPGGVCSSPTLISESWEWIFFGSALFGFTSLFVVNYGVSNVTCGLFKFSPFTFLDPLPTDKFGRHGQRFPP